MASSASKTETKNPILLESLQQDEASFDIPLIRDIRRCFSSPLCLLIAIFIISAAAICFVQGKNVFETTVAFSMPVLFSIGILICYVKLRNTLKMPSMLGLNIMQLASSLAILLDLGCVYYLYCRICSLNPVFQLPQNAVSDILYSTTQKIIYMFLIFIVLHLFTMISSVWVIGGIKKIFSIGMPRTRCMLFLTIEAVLLSAFIAAGAVWSVFASGSFNIYNLLISISICLIYFSIIFLAVLLLRAYTATTLYIPTKTKKENRE